MTGRAGASTAAAVALGTATVVAAALFAWRAATSPDAAMIAYTAAYVFATSTLVGALALVCTLHLTGASWFVPLRRLSLAVAGALPAAAVTFVPIALELRRVFPWAQAHERFEPRVQRALDHAAPWMNATAFVVRAAVILLAWIALSEALRRASLHGRRARERRLSAGGLVVVVVTLSVAAFDWVMSAIPGWSSNMTGVYLFAGAFASGVGATCVAAHFARAAGLLPPEVDAAHAHALGRVLFTSVCAWAYIAFCQVLLVWIANLPSEVPFLLDRVAGGWRWGSALLAAGHFAAPFVLLLARGAKRRFGLVAAAGGWVVVMHALDCAWLVVPEAGTAARTIDAAPFVALAAAFALVARRRFFDAAPVPNEDPDLAHGLEYESP